MHLFAIKIAQNVLFILCSPQSKFLSFCQFLLDISRVISEIQCIIYSMQSVYYWQTWAEMHSKWNYIELNFCTLMHSGKCFLLRDRKLFRMFNLVSKCLWGLCISGSLFIDKTFEISKVRWIYCLKFLRNKCIQIYDHESEIKVSLICIRWNISKLCKIRFTRMNLLNSEN